ncbi:NifU family SUF system FeS assembly protein [Enterococcus sp. 10A9_DIV0425]|uniref:NifU family SUF system FeS assembly protein n=1 Tax=Candidatus Enterococcus wittei TaxID=1987383 RepID=A0A242JY13_9ENTE|nr:SUF system NifU family Fe-S cluster assembly protein [Enterococcus sp. 10A9_DIV0425]OTP10206.1 NifU family SUF system FeS assembly protein [Enterococcus sp. 10A9_DIV0425]THE14656.1 SUF system NifU family Fe-S cluster assembly protein [Enterococcus hirae]
MGLSKLDNLYRQVILDHSAYPHHHGTLSAATSKIEMNNPTCGDVIELQVDIKDGRINNIAFDGSGCSISTASASMMTDAVIGKTIEEAMHLTVDFLQLVQGKETRDPDQLGDAAILSGVAKFPARIKCATLAWKALGKAMEEDGTATFHHDHKEEE